MAHHVDTWAASVSRAQMEELNSERHKGDSSPLREKEENRGKATEKP